MPTHKPRPMIAILSHSFIKSRDGQEIEVFDARMSNGQMVNACALDGYACVPIEEFRNVCKAAWNMSGEEVEKMIAQMKEGGSG